MGFIRSPAVAGQFYPGDSKQLSSMVERYLEEAGPPAGPPPKALIAPHAGYVYSGPIAASAYNLLRPVRGKIEHVILLGPCHRVPVRGMALSGADAFETPLGNVSVDKAACETALTFSRVEVFDATHELEHSLEVHLPFLQTVLGDFQVVPMVVGEAAPESVAEVLEALWGGPETLIVISSDLSHYLDYDSARKIDGQTCQAIEALDPSKIAREGACGRFPVGGLLAVARKRGLTVTTLDLRNSGDTAGPRDRVVGYGSWAFAEPVAKAGGDDLVETGPEDPPPPPPRAASVQWNTPSKTGSSDSTAVEARPPAAVRWDVEPDEKSVPGKTEATKESTEADDKPKPRAVSITLNRAEPVSKKQEPRPGPSSQADDTGQDRPPTPSSEMKTADASPPQALDESSFEDATRKLLEDHGANILLLAALSIDHGLEKGKPVSVDASEHPDALRREGACFVTLKKNGQLRGCIGSPQAHRALVVDVAENAYRAAFNDPRFPKLEAAERDDIDISISVLSPQVPISFDNEDELLAQLRPGIDGLVIADGGRRALFLPSVWLQLPKPRDFLNRLKIKAAMSADHWSDSFEAWRFVAEEVSAADPS